MRLTFGSAAAIAAIPCRSKIMERSPPGAESDEKARPMATTLMRRDGQVSSGTGVGDLSQQRVVRNGDRL